MLLIKEKIIEGLLEAKAEIDRENERGGGVHENIGEEISEVIYDAEANKGGGTGEIAHSTRSSKNDDEGTPPVFTSEVSPAENSAEDKLHTREVTTALNELLTNWFGGGGMFGMGKGGIEHPEYLEVKEQLITDLLHGDVPPDSKIKPDTLTSIKTNVNAWRDTYGISPNGSELFEHYLRRVIIASNEHEE